MAAKDVSITFRPAGYQYFIDIFELKVIPHYRQSYISSRGQARIELNHSIERHIYPKSLLPEETIEAQLEFALKHDGINLEILRSIFLHITVDELVQIIQAQPTSKYIRKIWFLYEFIFDQLLPIKDLTMGNYVDLLSDEDYFTSSIIKSARHRINNNLLGNRKFCPMVRKTAKILNFIDDHLQEKIKSIFQEYPKDIVNRANQFLYLKETKSSYAIEKEQPNLNRTSRFVQALHDIESTETLTKSILIELQNTIVESRFIDEDYRKTQNYVGQTLSTYRQKIHYISPRPEDLPGLMEGFLEMVNHIVHECIDPVVIAATCSFAFVYLHPFDDGNGRLHRLLIHYLLTRTRFTPKNVILPVSAVMLAEPGDYDNCLESFSKTLLNLIDYDLDNEGILTVLNETVWFYCYFDATKMVEYLYETINKVVTVDLIEELEFIVHYDAAKREIQQIIDMPDNKIDLFIKLVSSASGSLSKTKRSKFFFFLSDEEVARIEEIVKKYFKG